MPGDTRTGVRAKLHFFDPAKKPAQVEKATDTTPISTPAEAKPASAIEAQAPAPFASPVNADAALRRSQQTVSTFDTVTTIGTRTTNVVASVLSLTGHQAAHAASEATGLWILGDPLPSLVANLLYAVRIIKTPGKQNRSLKVAASLLGSSTLLLTSIVLATLGITGFALGLVIAPFVSIAVGIVGMARMTQRWARAFRGREPEELLKQKIEKANLATEAEAINRENHFIKESLFLDYFIEDYKNTHGSISKDDEAFKKELADYNTRASTGKTHEKVLDKLVKQQFENDYNLFFKWLEIQRSHPAEERDQSFDFYDRAAKDKALSIIQAEHSKFNWRTAFLIAVGIMATAAILASLSAALPFFLPAAAATLTIIGAAAGGTVLASSVVTGVMNSFLNYKQYQAFAEANKHNPELVSELKKGVGLQITGASILLASGIVVGTILLCIPLVNVGVLAAVAAAALIVSVGCFAGGLYTAYKARVAANEAKIAEEAADIKDREIAELDLNLENELEQRQTYHPSAKPSEHVAAHEQHLAAALTAKEQALVTPAPIAPVTPETPSAIPPTSSATAAAAKKAPVTVHEGQAFFHPAKKPSDSFSAADSARLVREIVRKEKAHAENHTAPKPTPRTKA